MENPEPFHKGYIRTHSGYIMRRRPDHPRADRKGYVREHILVMEATIGRYLADGEVPHHINGKKDDNRPENLQLMQAAEHRSLHSRQIRKHFDADEAARLLADGYVLDQVTAHFGVSIPTLKKRLRAAGIYVPRPRGTAGHRVKQDIV